MSGAGKSALAREIVKGLKERGTHSVLLDGDVIREVFGADLGHSVAERQINAARVSKLSLWLENQGVNVVAAVLSIFPDWQNWNREHLTNYFEVYVDSDFKDLVRRDSKGLYRAGIRGDLKDVVGVDIPFPRPPAPDFTFANSFGSTNLREIAVKVLDAADQKFLGG